MGGALFLAGFVGATPLVRDAANRIAKTRVGAILEPLLLILLLVWKKRKQK